jgi:conjugative transfer signal peptidase TraF
MRFFIEVESVMSAADKANVGVEKEAGSGHGFVEQDKGTCGTVRHFRQIAQRTRGLFPGETAMSWIPYRTADSIPGSPAFWLGVRQLEAGGQLLSILTGLVIAGALLIWVGEAFGILVANTDSAAPAGVYRIASGSFRRGDLVAACLPVVIARQGLVRGYLRTGACPGDAEPVGKIVGALPGDTVAIERDGVAINGVRIRHSAVTARDSAGRPLPHVAFGTYRVAPAEVWLFGFHDRRSWDARYFGPIPLGNVRGALESVLAW